VAPAKHHRAEPAPPDELHAPDVALVVTSVVALGGVACVIALRRIHHTSD
jgi:hypothetical protein